MNFKIFKRLLVGIAIILIGISVSTAVYSGGQFTIHRNEKSDNVQGAKQNNGGPPPHAPAHGYRAKYQYRYYPENSVYYDTSRKLYFYLKADRWEVTATLPLHIHLNFDTQVNIEMESDRPYLYYHEHKQKYPPGQLKQKERDKTAKKNHKNKQKQ